MAVFSQGIFFSTSYSDYDHVLILQSDSVRDSNGLDSYHACNRRGDDDKKNQDVHGVRGLRLK